MTDAVEPRRTRLPILALACLVPSLWAQDQVRNASAERERWNATDSPYLDLRRTIGGVNPGASIEADGIECTMRALTIPRLYNQEDRSVQATTGQEDRQYGVYAQVRQMRLVGPVGWEVKAGYAGSAVTGPHGDPVDPFFGLSWNLASERRWGVTVYGGVGLPCSSTTNWSENHGGASYRAELRASGAIGMWALTTNFGVTSTPNGENEDARGITIPTAPPSTATTWDTDFLGLDGRALLTYRFSRWFRLGLLQEVTRLHWDGQVPYVEVSQTTLTAPTSVVAEWNLTRAWHASFAIGRDFITSPRPDGLQAELGITKTFYP